MISYTYQPHVFHSKFSPEIKINYFLAVPEDYTVGEKLPMIVFLHGAGERGDDVNLVLNYALPKLLAQKGLPVRALVLMPQVVDPYRVWNLIAEPAFELIDQIAKENNADPDRISLTGISMGGYGTWELGILHPDYFSALGPICGGGMPWRCDVLTEIPIRAFHGDMDDVVPISASYEMVESVKKHGGHPEFFIEHGVGHECWDYAYEETNLIEWLVSKKRK